MFTSYDDGMSRSTLYLPSYSGWPTARQTNEEDRHLKAHSKTMIISVFAYELKALANSRGSYPLADMETSDNQTTLSIKYTASTSDRLARIDK